MLEAILPVDPLASSVTAPTIEALIPCHRKDVALLSTVVAGVLTSSTNPVSRVRVVCSARDGDVVKRALEGGDRRKEAMVTIEHDDDVLGTAMMQRAGSTAPPHRRGWLVQQLVKFKAAATTPARATLVVDADTVLVGRRTWVTESGSQILPTVREFHRPYAAHAQRVWGDDARPLPVSFVAHHMLLQRDVLQTMLGDDPDSGMCRWIDALDWKHQSAGSEYHSYGTWLLRNQPNRVALAQWANVGMAPPSNGRPGAVEAAITRVRARHPRALSISFHEWMSHV